MRVALMGSSIGIKDPHLLDGQTIHDRLGGNTGNIAFVNAIDLHLERRGSLVPWATDPKVLRDIADVIVLCCANQLGPHVDLGEHAWVLEKAQLPVLAVGLGAQAANLGEDVELPSGTLHWLDVLSSLAPSSAPSIGVRGEYTWRQLERLGLGRFATVTGCPSNFTRLDGDHVSEVLERQERPIRRVASAAGQPHWPALGEIERSILDLFDETDGSCVIQHDLLMVHLGQAEFNKISPAEYDTLRKYFRPHLSNEEFAYWCRRNMLCFANVESWMAWLRRHDMVVGPRFHGVMLAIQAGVPGACIAHDSRTQELCETMAIPVKMASNMTLPVTLESLRRDFQFDGERYRATRRQLAERYVALLRGANLEIHPKLAALVQPQANEAAVAGRIPRDAMVDLSCLPLAV